MHSSYNLYRVGTMEIGANWTTLSALLRNWDIDGRVNVLKQLDIHGSRCLLNHKHMSLYCCWNVSTVPFEILLGGQKSSARRTTPLLPLPAGLTSSIFCFQLRESITIFWTFCVAASELSG